MVAALGNIVPMFGGVLRVVQHWPRLPLTVATLGQTLVNVSGGVLPVVQHRPAFLPPFTTLGKTLANEKIANVGQNPKKYPHKCSVRNLFTLLGHLFENARTNVENYF